jgi:hypothetical protein
LHKANTHHASLFGVFPLLHWPEMQLLIFHMGKIKHCIFAPFSMPTSQVLVVFHSLLFA